MTKFKQIQFNINSLIKNLLIFLPILFSIIAVLVVLYIDGIESSAFWGMLAGFSIFLQLLYTISFFIHPKYFVAKSKKYMPFWYISSILSVISEFILVYFHDLMIFFFLPLTLIAFFGGLLVLNHTKRKYPIETD